MFHHPLGLYARALVSALVFSFILVSPAFANGPIEAPDGSGPGLQDYTGFSVVYLIPGFRSTNNLQVNCLNVGTQNVEWTIQLFSNGNSPPGCEGNASRTLKPQSFGILFTVTSFGGAPLEGTCPTTFDSIVRVIASGKKPQLLCNAYALDIGTSMTITDVPMVPVGRAPRVRIRTPR